MNDEDVRLFFLSALKEKAQFTYLANWEIWVNYFRYRKITPTLGTSIHNWGRDVLGFSTRRHTFAKSGGWALAVWFGEIRFPHLVGGRGYSDGGPSESYH